MRALYSAAAIAGATAGGGPPAGASMARFLRSRVGIAAMDRAIDFTLAKEDVDTANMATGGLVMEPTLAMIGEAGPELVLPLPPPNTKSKRKRKVSKYQKEFGRQMKKLKAKHPRTPVSSLMARGHTATRKALKMPRKRRRA